VWRDPWFCEISICVQNGTARFNAMKSPRLAGRVMQLGTRFLVHWDSDSMDTEAWLQPPPSAGGALTLAKVDPDADFSSDFEDLSFTRERDCD